LLAVALAVAYVAVGPKAPIPAAEMPAAVGKPDALPAGAIRRLGWSPLRIGRSAFALRPDGKEIITVSPDGIALRFDARTGRLLERRSILDRSSVNPINPLQLPCAELSHDGRIVAIMEGFSESKSCTVIDVATGKTVYRHASGTEMISSARLSPDGNQLAVAERPAARGGDVTLRIYDTKTGKSRDLARLESIFYSLSFSGDGSRLAALETVIRHGEKPRLCYFDVPGAKQLWKRPLRDWSHAVSPDGRTIVAAVTEEVPGFQVIEMKRSSGEPAERFINFGTLKWFVPLEFAPDNRTLAFLYGNDQLVLLDIVTGTTRKRIALPNYDKKHGQSLGAFSADGKTVVTNRGYLQRWDLDSGKPLFEPPANEQPGLSVTHVAFTADGTKIFAGASHEFVPACWDAESGKPIQSAPESRDSFLMHTRQGPRLLEVLDRKREGLGWHREWLVRVSDPAGARQAKLVQLTGTDGQPFDVSGCLDLSGDGNRVFCVYPFGWSESRTIVVCDVKTGRGLTQFTVQGEFSISRPPFSPCGRWIVLGDSLFHVATGRSVFTLRTPDGDHLYLSNRSSNRSPVWFSGDGRLVAGRLATAAGKVARATDTLAIWEVATGNVLARFPRAGVIGEVAFSPDSRRIALVDGQGVQVHDLITGRRIAQFDAPDVACEGPLGSVTGGGGPLAFSPDGKTLATGHRDGSVTLWQIPSPPASPRLAAGEAERLWADLRSDNAVTARAAVERLVVDPKEAISLLRARFTPRAGKPGIARLIDQLDGDAFFERETAQRKLVELGDLAEMPLRKAARTTKSLEARRRIEAILQKITPVKLSRPLTGATLRGVRASEVLERLGTAPARKLLDGWADQTVDIELAAEARAVLGTMVEKGVRSAAERRHDN
jgi:WD40 repeat protein